MLTIQTASVAPELIGALWVDSYGDDIPLSRYINAAYKDMYGRLASVKRWPWKVVNPWAFRGFLIESTLAIVYRGLSTDDNTRYKEEADRRAKLADLRWGHVEMLYDENQDHTTSKVTTPATPVLYLGGRAY